MPKEGKEGECRMVPLSEGARGRSLCVALPRKRGGGEGGWVGGVYIATALSCTKVGGSWGEYLGSLR